MSTSLYLVVVTRKKTINFHKLHKKIPCSEMNRGFFYGIPLQYRCTCIRLKKALNRIGTSFKCQLGIFKY